MIHDITANIDLECNENRKHAEETMTNLGVSIKTIDGVGNAITHVKDRYFLSYR